jgi:hypothetical protein
LPEAGRNSSKHHHLCPAYESTCFPAFFSFLIIIELPHVFPFPATRTSCQWALSVDPNIDGGTH